MQPPVLNYWDYGLGLWVRVMVRVMVEFGTSSAFRGWVRVRVLG